MMNLEFAIRFFFTLNFYLFLTLSEKIYPLLFQMGFSMLVKLAGNWIVILKYSLFSLLEQCPNFCQILFPKYYGQML